MTVMQLIQILLPVYDNQGRHFPASSYGAVRAELTERFGGLTAYSRAPAEGLWREENSGRATHDDIVVYEVMTEDLDREWWSAFRKTLAEQFRQEDLVVRAHPVERL
jgi:hypothetical protein